MRNQQEVYHDIRQLQRNDRQQRLMLVHTHSKKLMVDMTLVGTEYRGVVPQPYYYHAEHVEGGDDKQRIGKGQADALVWHTVAEERQTVLPVGDKVGAVHREFHDKETQHEAKCQAPRITHKNLQSLLWLAEEVIIHIRQQYTHQTSYQDAVNIQLNAVETVEESAQGYKRQAGSKSVDTVDKVHGIVDESNTEHRKREAYSKRYLVDSAEAVQVVDIQSGKGKQTGGYYLEHEFRLGVHAHYIVGDAYGIDDKQTYDATGRPLVDHYLLLSRDTLEGKEHDDGCQQHTGQEGDAAEPWNGCVVHLALVRYVI